MPRQRMWPHEEFFCLKEAIRKENEALERNPYGPSPEEVREAEDRQMALQLKLASADDGAALKKSASAPNVRPYRLPVIGEAVRLTSIRSRPHLSGAAGEVIDTPDEKGFVTVLLKESEGNADQQPKSKFMKVQSHRLQPLDMASLPNLPMPPPSSSGKVSCKTASSPRSLAMSGTSRWSSSYASRTSKASRRSVGSGSVATLESHWHKQHLHSISGVDERAKPTKVIL
eukprot:TRINITY_DN53334_c0_g1_i1.p1 TRINITY_DN53334_c0_g1~~TRINITY_DN53334_c0_g1_i1.p1  ORF type:complete len:259 (+),score=45.25 TRINITY_DN53334_c0_g1_i1:92-778(+)